MPERYLLDFEEPLRQIRQKIREMEEWENKDPESTQSEIARLEEQEKRLSSEIYGKLTSWQRVQIARHPNRPYTLDYISMMMTDFIELRGDRFTGNDPAMVTGFARLGEIPVAVIGQQKGRDNDERIKRNFGMPGPEGYRKALRIMKLAEKFSRPIITFVDTPGAFPGIEAEKHGQGEAIARNLLEMSRLKTPIVVTIIGEGGSGGALGIGVGDRIFVLENAYYSVISPEGCAAILWKERSRSPDAAAALKLTAKDLIEMKIIDGMVKEPLGGAHRDPHETADNIKKVIKKELASLVAIPKDKLIKMRYDKIRSIGIFKEA